MIELQAIALRDAEFADFPRIAELNAQAVQHTSVMDFKRLADLDALSAYHRAVTVDGRVAGFVLAMREDAPYRNDNFTYFADRFDTFLYIDRIVIDPSYAGLKLGTLLYNDMFDYARRHAVLSVVCEYNIDPPNEPSRRFHDNFGFTEIGTQWLDGGKKKVSLQAANIPNPIA
jgi:predicted GNAT superfamily acetyltransferase